jgi:hypothetical protein
MQGGVHGIEDDIQGVEEGSIEVQEEGQGQVLTEALKAVEFLTGSAARPGRVRNPGGVVTLTWDVGYGMDSNKGALLRPGPEERILVRPGQSTGG